MDNAGLQRGIHLGAIKRGRVVPHGLYDTAGNGDSGRYSNQGVFLNRWIGVIFGQVTVEDKIVVTAKHKAQHLNAQSIHTGFEAVVDRGASAGKFLEHVIVLICSGDINALQTLIIGGGNCVEAHLNGTAHGFLKGLVIRAELLRRVDGKMDVTISGSGTAAVKAGWTTGAYTAGTTDAVGTTGMQNDAKVAVTVTVPDSTGAGGADETLTFTTANLDNAATIDDVVAALKATTATNANNDTVTLGDMYDITATADGKINFALKDGKDGTITGVTYTADSGTAAGTDVKASMTAGAAIAGAAAGTAGSSGDYNVQTIEVENGVYKDRDRLASTVVKLKDEQIVNGAQLKIGTQTITLSDADADKGTVSPDKIYIGDLKKADGTIDMDVFTERLSQATADNTIWTVSAKAGKDGITLMEATNADGTSAGNAAAKDLLKDKDLTSEEGIKATLGYVSAAKDAVAGTAGKALNLQIGDTSDEFNQMKIEIGDMHVEAMSYTDDEGNTASIRDIDILTSENAQAAVDVIKNAINYVSGVRGDLGAYQNRLEHTANNLSVMAENIQDAESTIRDTDVAEEMMSYVKNNILVQSAQAMLAQANQVPQGVLQLLG